MYVCMHIYIILFICMYVCIYLILFISIYIYLSLIGIILRWGFLIWELTSFFFNLLQTYSLILVVFVFTTFRPNFTSGLLQVIYSGRNAESCNRNNNNFLVTVVTAFHSCCLSHHVLGRIWNRYLLTMLTWNRRDSMPLSAAPRAPKGDQGWIFWSYKSLSGLPESGPYRIFVLVS